ncbi:hypothetical protein [Marinibactrum halimedae]|uniref:hypothetical protein n=1 Tax=Marinibactrum halimedae TaxID=1444977 RepID=UPI001E532107|nr:hypothetical protein [Marinibactrum halimedae]MCD9458704.1 hypothetical protein [Marinibactrum halimedae]
MKSDKGDLLTKEVGWRTVLAGAFFNWVCDRLYNSLYNENQWASLGYKSMGALF